MIGTFTGMSWNGFEFCIDGQTISIPGDKWAEAGGGPCNVGDLWEIEGVTLEELIQFHPPTRVSKVDALTHHEFSNL